LQEQRSKDIRFISAGWDVPLRRYEQQFYMNIRANTQRLDDQTVESKLFVCKLEKSREIVDKNADFNITHQYNNIWDGVDSKPSFKQNNLLFNLSHPTSVHSRKFIELKTRSATLMDVGLS
jgi:hypothetical protein